jgi:hypothetical protein
VPLLVTRLGEPTALFAARVILRRSGTVRPRQAVTQANTRYPISHSGLTSWKRASPFAAAVWKLLGVGASVHDSAGNLRVLIEVVGGAHTMVAVCHPKRSPSH